MFYGALKNAENEGAACMPSAARVTRENLLCFSHRIKGVGHGEVPSISAVRDSVNLVTRNLSVKGRRDGRNKKHLTRLRRKKVCSRRELCKKS